MRTSAKILLAWRKKGTFCSAFMAAKAEYDALPPHASAELVNLVAAMLKQDASERPSLAEVARFAEMARAKHREKPAAPTGNERGGARRRR